MDFSTSISLLSWRSSRLGGSRLLFEQITKAEVMPLDSRPAEVLSVTATAEIPISESPLYLPLTSAR